MAKRTIERRGLGKSGLEAAVVGIGTWRTFDVRGGKVERDRKQLVDLAVTAGVDLFDSSPMYGEAERVRLEMLEDLKADGRVGAIYWSCRPFGEGDPLRRPPVPADLASLAEFGVKTWPQALLKWVLSD